MPSLLAIFAVLLVLYFASYPYKLAKNYIAARKTGLPIIVVPIDQNNWIWIVISVPLRPLLKKTLPTAIYERLAITIWGWEFHQQLKPYRKHASPQGNDKSYLMVTCGRLELSTWDREAAWEVTRRPRDFQQSDLVSQFVGKFGDNVLTSNGERWSKQRKVIASVINERISKAVFNETIRQTDGLLGEVYDHADGKSSDTNQLFNMMKKITIHVLSGAGMGASTEWKNDERLKPRDGYEMTYIEACKMVIEAVSGPIIVPQWLMNNWPKAFPGHDFMKNLGVAMREFPVHTGHLIEEERQRVKTQGGETKSNILSQLLQASEGNVKAGKSLSEDEMMGNLFVFTAAGFDTTANTLSYALVLLCRYPEWQDWIMEEIDNLLPANTEEPVDYVAIFPKVVRIMAVLLETLRLFVPLVHLAKETKTPQVIETSSGKYELPANTTVYVNLVGLHLDPDVWRDLNKTGDKHQAIASKPDEYAFRPDRWVNPPDSSSALFQPPKGSYAPWSAGPRVCPGQKMAQVEFTATFLALFRRHRIEMLPMKVNGRDETRAELEARLDALMMDSISLMTLQMEGVYDVKEDLGDRRALTVRFSKRR